MRSLTKLHWIRTPHTKQHQYCVIRVNRPSQTSDSLYKRLVISFARCQSVYINFEVVLVSVPDIMQVPCNVLTSDLHCTDRIWKMTCMSAIILHAAPYRGVHTDSDLVWLVSYIFIELAIWGDMNDSNRRQCNKMDQSLSVGHLYTREWKPPGQLEIMHVNAVNCILWKHLLYVLTRICFFSSTSLCHTIKTKTSGFTV